MSENFIPETDMVLGGKKSDERENELANIRKKFKETGQLFVDKDFPTTDESLYYSETPPEKFEWKRPKVKLLNFLPYLGKIA